MMRKKTIIILYFITITLSFVAFLLFFYRKNPPIAKGKRAVLFFLANPKQKIRLKKIRESLQPDELIVVSPGEAIDLHPLKGHYRYILFTGDHGDIHRAGDPRHGAPSTINGMAIEAFERALAHLSIRVDLLILDTCFSAAALPCFIKAKVFSKNALAITALGVCQGWTTALISAEKGAPLAPIFVKILHALEEKFNASYHSIALYRHGQSGAGTLYKKHHQNLSQALESVAFLGIDESIEDLTQIEDFLQKEGIASEEKEDLDELFQEFLQGKRL